MTLQVEVDTPWAPFDLSLIESLRLSPWKVVDVETTGLTPASEPVQLSQKQMLFGFDNTLRCRAISATWWDGGVQKAAWDLDAGDPGSRRALAAAALTGIFGAHNGGFDLYWVRNVFGEYAPWPTEVVDTLPLARYAAPETTVRLMKLATEKGPAGEAAAEMVAHRSEGWSLAALVLVRFGRILDKSLQKPRHWVLPAPLSDKHYAYSLSDVEEGLDLLCDLIGGKPETLLEDWLAWKGEFPLWDFLLARQTADVVRIRENGLPWSQEGTRAYRERQLIKATEAAGRVAVLAPELAPFREALADPEQGEPDAYKQALAGALNLMGIEMPRTGKGALSTSVKDLKVAGVYDHPQAGPLMKEIEAAKTAGHAAQMAVEYAAFAGRSQDGRIHALLSHGPGTGRLSAQEPNIQNPLRDDDFRALAAPPAGSRMVSIDYSAIEMRIAAALAIRAQREILAAGGAKPISRKEALFLMRQAEEAAKKASSAGPEERGEALGWRRKAEEKAQDAEFRYLWGYVQQKAREAGEPEWSALRNVFRRRADPHLYTGLKLLSRDPELALDLELAETLKKEPAVKDGRQKAKPANFGLTYGMLDAGFRTYAKANYDLDLTLQEAGKVRRDWLVLYPEIRLWQLWTLLNPVGREKLARRNRHGAGVSEATVSLYRVRTLLGREFVTTDGFTALNYPDQGSGAEIVMLAVRFFSEEHPWYADWLAHQVHDELIVVPPDYDVDGVVGALTKEMLRAGDLVLGPYGVPVEVEASKEKDGSWPRRWRH